MARIDYVVVVGKEVRVMYESGRYAFYMKAEDLPKMLGGVHVLPKTVVDFMRKNPDRVR